MKKRFSLLLLASLLISGCGSSGHSGESYSTSQSSSIIFSSEASSREESSKELSSEESSEELSSEEFSEQSSSEEPSEELSSEESSEQSSSEEIPTYDPALYYDGYYSSISSWTDGEDLKEQLYTLLHNENYHPLNYNKPNWLSNRLADRSLTDFAFVDGVYSENDIDASRTQRGWQREHAFPATLMTGSTSANAVKFLGRATDFHNLFASDASANMSRGNKNYGVADKEAESYQDRTVNEGYDGYSFDEITFEPATHDKGRLARAIFYMATMYSHEEYDSFNNVTMKGLTVVEEDVPYVAGNDCNFAIGHLSELLTWNDVSVDYLEMQHNQSVYQDVIEIHSDPNNNVAQGNRNPYVDYPELIEYVYGDKKDEPGELKYIMPSYLSLNMDKDEIHHYAIEEAKREYAYGDTLTSEDYSIVAVKNDQSMEKVTEGVTHSLENHTFTHDDEEWLTATVNVADTTLLYDISLNPMNTCTFNSGPLTKDGLSVNKTSEVTYNSQPFEVTVTGGSGMAFYNDNKDGGFYMGSGSENKDCTGITIKCNFGYTIDKAYIKCRANNNSSSFKLTIKVGDATVLDNINITSNNGQYAIYGGSFAPTFGQVSFILTGSNALRINSFAFNVAA